MNRFGIFALITFYFSISQLLISQCPTGNILLKDQQSVNSFFNNYPNCHKILGSITFQDSETSQITDVSRFSVIDTVLGNFLLNTKGIANIEGFDNIKYIGGDFGIIGNTRLNEITHFNHLERIKGELSIFDNPEVTSITGFEKLHNIGQRMALNDLYKLKSINCFANLDTLGNGMQLGYMPLLETLDGFEKLKYSGGISISPNNKVIRLPSFNALEHVNGDLTMGGTNITSYTGLNALKKVKTRMIIYFAKTTNISIASKLESVLDLQLKEMPLLQNLEGFDSLKNAGSILISLPGLTQLQTFNKTNSINGPLTIYCEKLTTINAFRDLKFTKGITMSCVNVEKIMFAPDLEKVNGEFSIISFKAKEINEFENLKMVSGNFRLTISEVPNVPMFSNLEYTGGLDINSLKNIKVIAGFNKLKTIEGQLSISSNALLESITSFNNLEICRSMFYLKSNNSLTSISTFNSLDTLGGLSFFENRKLESISGFGSLKYLYIDKNFPISFSLYQCWALKSISGFEQLEKCGGILIDYSSSVEEISGFSSLKYMLGSLTLDGRSITKVPDFNQLIYIDGGLTFNSLNVVALPTMDHLETINGNVYIVNCLEATSFSTWKKLLKINGSITIGNLIKIKSISGLKNVDPFFVKELNINGNLSLSICNNRFVCGYLDLGKPANIQNNKAGCNSKNDIDCNGGFIYGQVFYDRNRNKIKDGSEKGFPNVKIDLNDGEALTFSNDEGQFGFYVEANNVYKIKYQPDEGFELSTDSMVYHVEYISSSTSASQRIYGVYQSKSIHGGSIDITSNFARCNQKSEFKIHTFNTGTYDEKAEVRLWYKNFSDIDSFSPPPSFVDAQNGFCIWEFDNFIPPSKKEFTFVVNIPSEEFVGDTLTFKSEYRIKDGSNATIILDTTIYETIVRCAFDPNDITVNPIGKRDEHFIPNTSELQYTIRFQNIGNDTAQHVTILNDLPEYLDVESFQYISTSHQVYIVQSGKRFEFYFRNANLVDSLTNKEKSQGYISYKIKLKPDLLEGTRIENFAKIFFDENAPIITNIAYNTIEKIRSNSNEISIDKNNFCLYPNPASNTICMNSNKEIKVNKYIIYDIMNRKIHSGYETCIDISHLSIGNYFVNILHERGISTLPFVKE